MVQATVARRLGHEPLGWRPATLLVTVHCQRCLKCGVVCGQGSARAVLSRSVLRWSVDAVLVHHLTAAHVAAGLVPSWNTATARCSLNAGGS